MNLNPQSTSPASNAVTPINRSLKSYDHHHHFCAREEAGGQTLRMKEALTQEDQQKFIYLHPAQVEIADIEAHDTKTPLEIRVRQERWELRKECHKLIHARAEDATFDLGSCSLVHLTAHRYNGCTDRGETIISCVLRFRELYDYPGPHEGIASPTDLVINGFPWKQFYPDFDSSFKKADIEGLLAQMKRSRKKEAAILEYMFEGRR